MAAVAVLPTLLSVGPVKSPRPSTSPSNKTKDLSSQSAEVGTVVNVQEVKAEDKGETKKEQGSKSPAGPAVTVTHPETRTEFPQRPPARPHAAVRSKFDLEPNPFEQSFSKDSHHSNSSTSGRTTPPRGGDATSIKHNDLPPLSSLTSPAAADPSHFPWLASQSLRTGPLSPAMLAGPTQNGHQNGQPGARPGQHGDGVGPEGGFDTSNFRTGFTPGTGSDFTPGYNALMNGNFTSSLPMPSPNTAAFLNMVTNSSPLGEGGDGHQHQANDQGNQAQSHPPSAIPPHMQRHHGLSHLQPGPDAPQDTITPNTLSALTGVFNDMNRAQGQSHSGAQYYPPHMPHPHPGQHIPGQVDYAQQSANAASQAANGLFLLSQAHQELSKREEADTQDSPTSTKRNSMAPPGKNGTGGQKRKSDGSQKPQGPAVKKGKKVDLDKAKIKSVSPNLSQDTGDDGDDGDEMQFMKGDTEEDKRKNFLERNRQAALKCRQRKKAWLNELQNKVEQLTMENERLQQTIGGLHDEVGRLSTIMMQHRDCGLGMPTGYGRPIH